MKRSSEHIALEMNENIEEQGSIRLLKPVFDALFHRRKSPISHHSKEAWDDRAKRWANERKADPMRWESQRKRIDAVTAYLHEKNLLTNDKRVMDIGCGLGQFVAEFAKTAEHVTGIDISTQMLEFGERTAKERGLDNVRFEVCDFADADIEAKGWSQAYDLVFSSITPAIRNQHAIDKMIAMSRAYCMNCSFVFAKNIPEEDVLREAFGIVRPPRWDGRSFYAMFNMLWMDGYYPETSYYKEIREHAVPLTKEWARTFTAGLSDQEQASEEEVERAYRYLETIVDADGLVHLRDERWYGWILWDVRDRDLMR